MTTIIKTARIHTINLPIKTPFTTSFSTQTVRNLLIVELLCEVDGTEVTGWGECGSLPDPFYSAEYNNGVKLIITDFLLPTLLKYQQRKPLSANTVAHALRKIVGHQMAKSVLEMAVLDAELRVRGLSMGEHLGAVVEKVPAGVSVGIKASISELLREVETYIAAGYQRIKLKIMPGWDIEPVKRVREEFGMIPLQVDANSAYTLQDAQQLRKLDDFELLLIEQPLGYDDIRQHAQLAKTLATPLCLDESIVSAQSAADAIMIGATTVINIKPSRVGGYLEAKRIHDLATAHGIAVWCGGMLETGLGRTANAALAALEGFTLPGDISGSSRFYENDLTEPVEMHNGFIAVSKTPGVGPEPLRDRLREFTEASVQLKN